MVTFSLKKKEYQIQKEAVKEAPIVDLGGALDNDLPDPIIPKCEGSIVDDSTQLSVKDDTVEPNFSDVVVGISNFDTSSAVDVIKETMHTHGENGQKDRNFDIKADIFHAGSFTGLDFFIWYNKYLGMPEVSEALEIVGTAQRLNNSALISRSKPNRVQKVLDALKEEKQLEFALAKEAKGLLH
jgi:hypothetical protein